MADRLLHIVSREGRGMRARRGVQVIAAQPPAPAGPLDAETAILLEDLPLVLRMMIVTEIATNPDGLCEKLSAFCQAHSICGERVWREAFGAFGLPDLPTPPLGYANFEIAFALLCAEIAQLPDAELPFLARARSWNAEDVDEAILRWIQVPLPPVPSQQQPLGVLGEVLRMLGANRARGLQRRDDTRQLPTHVIMDDPVRVQAVLSRRLANLEAVSSDGDTPLTLAASLGRHQIAAALLTAGANPEARRDGETPLLLVMHSVRGTTKVQMVRALIAGGADVNAREDTEQGYTALHLAMFKYGVYRMDSDRETVVRILLAAGADPLLRGRKDGKTPYDIAVRSEFKESASLLADAMRALGATPKAPPPPRAVITISSGDSERVRELVAAQRRNVSNWYNGATFNEQRWLRRAPPPIPPDGTFTWSDFAYRVLLLDVDPSPTAQTHSIAQSSPRRADVEGITSDLHGRIVAYRAATVQARQRLRLHGGTEPRSAGIWPAKGRADVDFLPTCLELYRIEEATMGKPPSRVVARFDAWVTNTWKRKFPSQMTASGWFTHLAMEAALKALRAKLERGE